MFTRWNCALSIYPTKQLRLLFLYPKTYKEVIMATKLQTVSELTARTMHRLTHSVDEWMSFLDSAAWLYKYPWHEQVMIYAQRPDATACASIELWNNAFRRWVNKGAKGIAIIDDSGAKPSLRYVFDGSDTNACHNVPFRLWEAREEHEEQILEELQNSFGEIGEYEGLSFFDQLSGIIQNAVADNSADYASALMRSLAGTESTAVLIPFRAHEIMDIGGVYCGVNAISRNLIIADRKQLINGNGFILGVSGSGKSFFAKREIIFLLLGTNDDIIIGDPQNEYTSLVNALGGAVVNLSICILMYTKAFRSRGAWE